MSNQAVQSTRFLVPTGPKDWVNFAKGTAIILVVLYHSMLFLRSIDFPVGGLGRVKAGLEMYPMPMFLFIAGLYHFRVLHWTLTQTWKRRLLGYLYLYVLWSILRFAFYFVVPNVRSDGAGATATNPIALLEILVWPISSYWFILALFMFTLLLWCVRTWPRWVSLAITAVISMLFSTGLVTALNAGWDRMGEYLVFFMIGAFFSQRLFTIIRLSRAWVVVAAAAVFAAAAFVAAFVPIGARLPGVELVGECAAVLFGASASVRLVRVRALGWISHLGVRSLQIYLVHIFVIAALTAAIVVLPGLARLPGHGLLVFVLLALSVILLSLFLGRVLSRISWLFVPPRWLQQGRLPRRREAQRSAVPVSHN